MAAPFATDGTLGVVFQGVYVSNLPFRTGQKVVANDGSEWMFVSSTAAITANSALWVNATYGATMLTPTLAQQNGWFGRAELSLSTSGQHCWVQLTGNMVTRVAAGCAANVPLYTTDTAGVVDDATVSLSQFQVWGLVAEGSNSAGSAGAITLIASWPTTRHPKAAP